MSKKNAVRFILLLGLVSLFADATYESARSITGPFLSLLGATGTAVGVIVGLGELSGYGLRAFFGFLSEKTEKYWAFTIIGYFINLFAVPMLAFVGSWQWAGFFIVLERFGKAIRVPARDTILSYATKETGRGWGFGLHELLDQVGAILGPLAMSLSLWKTQNYSFSFAILFIPAILALAPLFMARLKYPAPEKMERGIDLNASGLKKSFWLYLFASGLATSGFAQFALIAYHFQKASSVPSLWIPVFYSAAMAVAGLSGFFMGRLYDKKGISVLAGATFLSAFFAPLVFLTGFTGSLIGMILWGIGTGAHESLFRAVIPDLAAFKRRASAYGIFNLGFGVFWFLGSSFMGFLYDYSLLGLVVFSVFIQLASLPLFFLLKKNT